MLKTFVDAFTGATMLVNMRKFVALIDGDIDGPALMLNGEDPIFVVGDFATLKAEIEELL